MNSKKNKNAINRISKNLGLNPKNAQLYMDRGYHFSETGQYQQAIANYSKALKLDPTEAAPAEN